MEPFHDFDLSDFWEPGEYADEQYVGEPFTDADVDRVERELGFKIPTSYVALMRTQNGGISRNSCYRMSEPTSWAEDHVAIEGIHGIGSEKDCSLCGVAGSKFWMEEWGYPAIGIYFGDCPSAGHDMICLDYRECGPDGEPSVVHVDQESDYRITFVAKDFETFIRGLEPEEVFDEET
ncbi:SMI1/KNR4 family protein [Rhodopirellula halodulae]|uniref:SMI1/KNR4 family protein n=1 Tax=Rhodopirellula halodulae TaxID=2894198 RepID=UPI001E3FE81A|nr:SMI1/KNR4 family protein [Rhodopirellula sp. JC740]